MRSGDSSTRNPEQAAVPLNSSEPPCKGFLVLGGRVPRPSLGHESVPVIASVWLMGCLLAIVTSTPYRGDDLANKEIRRVVEETGQTLPGFTGHVTQMWMASNGRFIPGNFAWTYSLFWVFGSRMAYKFVIGIVLIGAMLVFGLFILQVTGRWSAAAVFIPIVFGLIQVRTFNDGIVSYAALLPLTAGLSIAAVVIVISRRGMRWAVVAAVLYSLALVTYETVFLFAPVMVAIVIWARRAWRPALSIAIPFILELGIVTVLRLSMRVPPSSGYTINLQVKPVLVTFAKQALAAFPLSQWVMSANSMPSITAGSIAVGVLAAGVPTFLSIISVGRSTSRATRAEVIVIGFLGAWIWLSSSALVAVTLRWQVEIHRGQGYLSVVFGYFGLALCLLSVYLSVDRFVDHRSTRTIVIWRYGSAFIIAVLVAVTLAGNLAVASLA